MKFNKWTLGLVAVGAVSLTSVAQAEEKMNVLQTAMTSTTISGYVDTSMQWNLGTGNQNLPGYAFGGPSKADGFNLNVVQLTIAKPLDEGEWASGYRADLWFGPDANGSRWGEGGLGLGTASPSSGDYGRENSDFAIRQAYVALRTPVGNGIDWKIGVFDGIIGYETLESGNNPNMTRSYGFTIEPTTQTGVLATYRFCDVVSASFGIANTTGPSINERAFDNGYSDGNKAESYKTYTGSVALTAPSNWGWLAGSSLYSGFITGFDSNANSNQAVRNNYYLGATVNTPVAGLKAGIALDYAHIRHGNTVSGVDVYPGTTVGGRDYSTSVNNQYAGALYVSYQATEKMSLHGRAEMYRQQGPGGNLLANADNKVYALTGTIQYDLWQNVLSRLEIRWDHSTAGRYGNSDWDYDTNDNEFLIAQKNAVMIAANVIYKF